MNAKKMVQLILGMLVLSFTMAVRNIYEGELDTESNGDTPDKRED